MVSDPLLQVESFNETAYGTTNNDIPKTLVEVVIAFEFEQWLQYPWLLGLS